MQRQGKGGRGRLKRNDPSTHTGGWDRVDLRTRRFFLVSPPGFKLRGKVKKKKKRSFCYSILLRELVLSLAPPSFNSDSLGTRMGA